MERAAYLRCLARAGYLYLVGATQAAGVVGPTFVLWNPGLKGLDLTVFSIIGSTGSNTSAAVHSINTDPGLALGPAPSNAILNGNAADAFLESDSSATPVFTRSLGEFQMPAGGALEMLWPAVVIVPPNSGLVLSFPLGAATASIRLLWGEIPRDWSNE
jgi:hypothetical protein